MTEKINEIRLLNSLNAYWDNSEDSDFARLHDVIVDTLDIDPTKPQMKAVFAILPANIIGSVISWGLRSTVVRDEIYAFIEENRDQALQAIAEQERAALAIEEEKKKTRAAQEFIGKKVKRRESAETGIIVRVWDNCTAFKVAWGVPAGTKINTRLILTATTHDFRDFVVLD